MVRPKLPLRDEVKPDTPLRLDVAVALAFPDGSMTASGLRREAARGRLVIERIAGKDYTTLANVEKMRELCRVENSHLGSTCEPHEKPRTANSERRQSGSSSMAGSTSPQDALRAKIDKRSRSLAEYIAAKHSPIRKEQDIELIDVADVLSIYDDDTRSRQVNISQFDKRLRRLNEFWGGKMLSQVTGETCRDYANTRGNDGGARRDLEDLRAAINHHAAEGFHRGVVRVILPAKGLARDRWLTRDEAARLIWTCWRYREMQVRHRGKEKALRLPTDKRPLRHLARFILIGLYTGTRAAAVATASPISQEGRSYVDLDRGIYYRLAQGKQATNKRQPPVPLPPRLLTHLRRWRDKGFAKQHFVEFNGLPVKSVKTAFKTAVEVVRAEGKDQPTHATSHSSDLAHASRR